MTVPGSALIPGLVPESETTTRSTVEETMKWPFLLLIPLAIYLHNAGAELLTVVLVLAIAAVVIQVVTDQFSTRRRRERA